MPREQKPRILVIDDDPDFLELYKLCLSDRFEVHLALDGEMGLRKLRVLKPSAILLDLRMPKVSGVEVLQSMQKDPELRRIPVIVVTAMRLDETLRGILDSVANVCESFDKAVSPKVISEEAFKMVDMGKLYRTTPVLVKNLHHAMSLKKRHPFQRQSHFN